MTQRLGNGQNIWEMAQMHGARLKYLRIGLNYVGNGFKNLTKGLNMWEMT